MILAVAELRHRVRHDPTPVVTIRAEADVPRVSACPRGRCRAQGAR
jgi:hypothetical protein